MVQRTHMSTVIVGDDGIAREVIFVPEDIVNYVIDYFTKGAAEPPLVLFKEKGEGIKSLYLFAIPSAVCPEFEIEQN